MKQGIGPHLRRPLGGSIAFRVAITDRRILSCDDGQVTFAYRKSGSRRPHRLTLPVEEFLRRFLQHVLPRGFQKVRACGFLSPNARRSFEAVRWLATLNARQAFTLRSEDAKPTNRLDALGAQLMFPSRSANSAPVVKRAPVSKESGPEVRFFGCSVATTLLRPQCRYLAR
ncbi:MAG: transposase [Gemmatimonadetes bacterium]|nr:transposase [Gemmatimonadota bacterium]